MHLGLWSHCKDQKALQARCLSQRLKKGGTTASANKKALTLATRAGWIGLKPQRHHGMQGSEFPGPATINNALGGTDTSNTSSANGTLLFNLHRILSSIARTKAVAFSLRQQRQGCRKRYCVILSWSAFQLGAAWLGRDLLLELKD